MELWSIHSCFYGWKNYKKSTKKCESFSRKQSGTFFRTWCSTHTDHFYGIEPVSSIHSDIWYVTTFSNYSHGQMYSLQLYRENIYLQLMQVYLCLQRCTVDLLKSFSLVNKKRKMDVHVPFFIFPCINIYNGIDLLKTAIDPVASAT